VQVDLVDETVKLIRDHLAEARKRHVTESASREPALAGAIGG
jgi:hypothetical protein